ncbi:CoA-binding protein [candidate division KSB1 bacterium]
MITRQTANDFIEAKKFALVGASTNKKKFSTVAMRELKKKGYQIIPVNPKAESIEEEKCYPDIGSLPAEIDSILIMTPKTETLKVLKEAEAKNIKNIWIQQGAQSPEVMDYIKEKNLNIIAKECIMMYADPVEGGHKFHRFIWKLIGKYAKN